MSTTLWFVRLDPNYDGYILWGTLLMAQRRNGAIITLVITTSGAR